ncbi:hypothetical protein A4W93_10645 [Piscinibacter gummiphilus]|uniref:Uncharacterized protein n=2 Tax=Piscinibacter gummiphilus TaxID=946333 RepID=A0A1W6L7K6_9BURK|nr:hypothetical protein A4W93_10645 [Piscinibacter gummiphilus]ATU64993.1 DUF4880 domain-containing protein [Piscinibacter gummiphilus]GLS96367.1 hypothetical protein GCM10007918_36590 [Piscinibacter gummiphilus]
MGISSASSQDPVWDMAWTWIQRQHATPTLDDQAARELAQWLDADPRHRAAYDQASRLWFVAGFVPPANPIDIPDAP